MVQEGFEESGRYITRDDPVAAQVVARRIQGAVNLIESFSYLPKVAGSLVIIFRSGSESRLYSIVITWFTTLPLVPPRIWVSRYRSRC
jgi:hypothetical protein